MRYREPNRFVEQEDSSTSQVSPFCGIESGTTHGIEFVRDGSTGNPRQAMKSLALSPGPVPKAERVVRRNAPQIPAKEVVFIVWSVDCCRSCSIVLRWWRIESGSGREQGFSK